MISLSFKQFMSGEYTTRGYHELYVLRNKEDILYIGISQNISWRWFGGLSSHLMQNIYGEWIYNSTAGEVVVRNMPESLDWTIELWTLRDCVRFLGGKIRKWKLTYRGINIIEPYMIMRLKPLLNVSLADGYHHSQELRQKYLPVDEDRLQAIYNAIFNK